ncbi:response regulator transcription factor [Nocardia sp. NPDC057440]|uniref:response regulator transcription factor n=1 Tax=Nocardia sp. NPDC057440 TaxID=3346134 RepID=UPI003672203A
MSGSSATALPRRSHCNRGSRCARDCGKWFGGELTERETEVLRLLAAGSANREIARTRYLSEGTVKNHVSSILSRLGVRDRTQAAIYAHERRLL